MRSAFPVLREAARRKGRTPPNAHRSVRAPAALPHHKHKTPAAARYPRSALAVARSSQASQLGAQLACGAEQRILHRLFRSSQRVADRAQLQPLIMFHLKNDALPRRKPFHCQRYPSLNLLPEEPALRVQRWPMLALPLEEIRNPFIRVSGVALGGLILGARLAPPQMIQADVGHDAIQPGVKAAFKAEAM